MEKIMSRADGLVPTTITSVIRNYFSKSEYLMLQNTTPVRKLLSGPPNNSDEDISCPAPVTENIFLQILFCPRRFLYFLACAISLSPPYFFQLSIFNMDWNILLCKPKCLWVLFYWWDVVLFVMLVCCLAFSCLLCFFPWFLG
jgi:hypothetical protein